MVTEKLGSANPLITMVAVLLQPLALVPVTVYVVLVVAEGVTVTALPEDALKPVDGVQLYVDAPVALKVVVVLAQILSVCVAAPFIKTVGNGLTVTALLKVCLLPQTPLT